MNRAYEPKQSTNSRKRIRHAYENYAGEYSTAGKHKEFFWAKTA